MSSWYQSAPSTSYSRSCQPCEWSYKNQHRLKHKHRQKLEGYAALFPRSFTSATRKPEFSFQVSSAKSAHNFLSLSRSSLPVLSEQSKRTNLSAAVHAGKNVAGLKQHGSFRSHLPMACRLASRSLSCSLKCTVCQVHWLLTSCTPTASNADK